MAALVPASTFSAAHSGLATAASAAASAAASLPPRADPSTLEASHSDAPASSSASEASRRQAAMLSMHSFNGAAAPRETIEHGRAPSAAATSAASADFAKGSTQSKRDTHFRMSGTIEMNSPSTDRGLGITTHANPTLLASSLFPSLKLPDCLGAGEAIQGQRRSSQDGIDDISMTDAHPATSTRPASASVSSARPTQPHLSAQSHRTVESKEEMDIDEHKSAVRSAASAGPARSALESARSKLKMTFATVAPGLASSIAVDARASPDISCHCLVIDESKMAVDSPDRIQLTTALGLAKHALNLHVIAWLGIADPTDLSVAYIDRASRLHLNFASMDGLARVLARIPFLARCGSLASGPWQGGRSPPCGLERHKLPEVLRISVLPAREVPVSELMPAVLALLESAHLEHTAVWFPNKQSLSAPFPARGGRDQSARINVYLLPRNILTIAADMARMHRQVELLGSKLVIDAPNNPALSRCRQCDKLGHRDTECPEYSGLGVRLLFKDKVPFATLLKLIDLSRARVGYLGSDVNDCTPSHRVTLLFDLVSEQDQAGLDRMVDQVAPVVSAYRALLHCEPDLVRPKDRRNECPSCGSLTRAHACPFVVGQQHQTGRRLGLSSLGASSSAASAQRSGAQPARASDTMCKSWRLRKQCPRLEKHQHCAFEHPESHAAQPQICFDFANTGHCHRGTTCSYEHTRRQHAQPLRRVQPPSVAAPAVALLAAPAAASASASRPAPVSASAPPVRRDSASAPAAATVSAQPASSASAAAPATPGRKRGRSDREKNSPEDAAAAVSTQRVGTAPAPTASASASKKKRVGPGSDEATSASASNKARLASLNSGIPTDNRWGALTDLATDEEQDQMDLLASQNQRVPVSTPPPSSLGSLMMMTSPAKVNKPARASTASSSLSRTPSKGRQ